MRSFRKMQFSSCSHSEAYFLKCRVFLCCFIITGPGVLYWVSKNEDHTIHKPISRMVSRGQVQNPLLQDRLQRYAPYSCHFSWSSPRVVHCLVTPPKRSGGPTDKSLLLCTAQPAAACPPCAMNHAKVE